MAGSNMAVETEAKMKRNGRGVRTAPAPTAGPRILRPSFTQSQQRSSYPPIVHFVYLVRCSDDTLYTGYTTDLDRRVEEHNEGTGAKYTRGRTPVELVYAETLESRSKALQREHALKQLSRSEKESLIEDDVENGVEDEIDTDAKN